jgi:hypothetical protein
LVHLLLDCSILPGCCLAFLAHVAGRSVGGFTMMVG